METYMEYYKLDNFEKSNLCKIGVDIEKIDRFEALNSILNKQFFKHIFTSKELDYCFQKFESKYSEVDKVEMNIVKLEKKGQKLKSEENILTPKYRFNRHIEREQD
jgi:hypothetical protein